MHTNALIHETSPYLLQHAHNPVNWYPWGEEAFERARREGKTVFYSLADHHVIELLKVVNEHVVEILEGE